MKYLLIVLLSTIGTVQVVTSQETRFPDPNEPGKKAAIFAPGVISKKGRLEQNITFSPTGNEIFFTIINKNWTKAKIVGIKYNQEKNTWQEIDTSEIFSDEFYETEPRFSSDGQAIYFVSTRPKAKPNKDWTGSHVWMSQRSNGSWGKPVKVPQLADAWHPHIDSESRAHFLSYGLGGFGGGDIFSSILEDSNTREPVNVGEVINSTKDDADPFVSPDGQFLLFDSNRKGGMGQFDMYVSAKGSSGEWTKAVNLGRAVNTKTSEYSGVISPGGRFFFFSRRYKNEEGQPENDIFWMNASILHKVTSKEPDESHKED